jgi:hypothetical protein
VLCMSACALYVAGMPEPPSSSSSSSTSTSADASESYAAAAGGSCVSLTQLLRATHIRYPRASPSLEALENFLANDVMLAW